MEVRVVAQQVKLPFALGHTGDAAFRIPHRVI